MHDLKHAIRTFRRNPGFTTVVVLLLSIGIGANTVIFSTANAILFRPLRVPNPEQLVRLVQRRPVFGTISAFEYPYYRNVREHSTTLSDVFGEASLNSVLTAPAPAEQVRINLTTPEFFKVLGVTALYGRVLTEQDARESIAPIPAVLSYRFCERRFGTASECVGSTIMLQRQRFVVVGVLRRDFNGITIDTAPDLRVPLWVVNLLRAQPGFSKNTSELVVELDMCARLKAGVTRMQAEAECNALWNAMQSELSEQFLPPELRTEVKLDPLEYGVSILRERYALMLKTLLASSVLLLFMLCANLSGLLLARTEAQQREIAVRMAIGASHVRLMRLTVTESLLLSLLGSGGAMLIAFGMAEPLRYAFPPVRDQATARLPMSIQLAPDHRVFLFSLALVFLTTIVVSVPSTLAATRTSIRDLIRTTDRTHRWRSWHMLIGAQVAACTILLAGAGVLVGSFSRLYNTDAGFDRNHVVTFSADPTLVDYTPQQEHDLLTALTKRIREMPNVASVAIASRGVLRGRGIGTKIAVPGDTSAVGQVNTSVNIVTPGYFSTTGMHLIAGRDLSVGDVLTHDPRKVAVNAAFVRRCFGNTNPIGKRVSALQGSATSTYEIIGVVSNAKYRSLREPITPTIYETSEKFRYFVLYVRTFGRPETVIQPVRNALSSLDPVVPFIEIHTLAEEIDADTAGERLAASLVSVFGAISAVLTCLGIYGLVAYSVTQRRREIAIRIALGAYRSSVVRVIAGQLLVVTVAGLLVGLGAAALVLPLMQPLVYAMTPCDWTTLARATIATAALVIFAAGLPLGRTLLAEPMAALRHDG